MASVSATILRDTLRYFKDHNVELAQLDVENVTIDVFHIQLCKLNIVIFEIPQGITQYSRRYARHVHFKDHNVELAQLDVENVNSLIKILDEQHDYHTLAWVFPHPVVQAQHCDL
jgi:hypothetical protein